MIIYQQSKLQFLQDVLHDRIADYIHDGFQRALHRRTSPMEVTSWRNSMLYMKSVLEDAEIPDDRGVAIEYQIPHSAKRLDLLITGRSDEGNENLVIVELKQWSELEVTDKDAIVKSFVGRGIQELPHPSYQAWSYASLLSNFNATIESDAIGLHPCAYLHNMVDGRSLRDARYKEHLTRAPAFISGEAVRLREFIKRHVKHGDDADLLYRIENGKIRPSKMLADSLASMIKGKPEFVLIDEQKVVYETAIDMARAATPKRRQVLVVRGGPGTGKSVVAINLLVELTRLGQVVQYVSKNAAPRTVYEAKLTGTVKKTAISNMFRGSGAFIEAKNCALQTLIVDEAHRLNKKSGLYGNLGENQVKEIIASSCCSIFFIDEDQRIDLADIGQIAEIRKFAAEYAANVVELELPSQFRCGGSDGYIAWLDDLLGIRPTANTDADNHSYDFRVLDCPSKLRDLICERNRLANKARLVAGYCWEWKSKKDSNAFDIEFPGTDFQMQWNLTKDGSLWIVEENSVSQVGCIHTCQGLELDYVGVIIGPDLVYRDGAVVANPAGRDRRDKTIKGWKKLIKADPAEAAHRTESIIKNTYRTLMTRGMKGCYVYATDPALRNYLRSRTERPHQEG
jgi:DUF2075 family protein